MAAKTVEPKKRVPLTEVDWQMFRFGVFAIAALGIVMIAGWMFGERGAHSHVDAKPLTATQAQH